MPAWSEPLNSHLNVLMKVGLRLRLIRMSSAIRFTSGHSDV